MVMRGMQMDLMVARELVVKAMPSFITNWRSGRSRVLGRRLSLMVSILISRSRCRLKMVSLHVHGNKKNEIAFSLNTMLIECVAVL